ncbi:MAG: dihydrofolate reductase family protein [Geodermatophilaceae bacterium]|nr:dihydrofolate reductase family protein [Geodermatophilaceae bacterium]MDQ3455835.1 dihydrofolate reductase family protein [Actinomycetota bacterium]
MRRLLPDPAGEVDLESEYIVDPDSAWHVRASFISSADGAVTLDGRSGGLGNAADKRVFGLARDLADVILVGAGTARAEAYRASRPTGARLERRRRHGLPDAPLMAVVSERLQLDLDSDLFPTDEPRTVVITSGASPPDIRAAVAEHAEVLVHGDDTVDLTAAVAALRRRGLRRVHCEGGPRLFAGLVAAGLVDELCLTLAPLLTGPGAERIVTGAPWPAPAYGVLRHVLEDENYLFLRYDLKRAALM